MDEVKREIGEVFDIKPLYVPTDDRDIVLSQFEREELRVKADTLSARLAKMRAVLYQKDAAPLTDRDLKLRKYILELYPKDRATPLSLGIQKEPKFTMTEKAP